MRLIRICQGCKKPITHKLVGDFNRAEKAGSKCRACGQRLRKPLPCKPSTRKKISKSMVVHGFTSAIGRHPLYACWSSIKQRCSNPRVPGFKYWGGRGIRVCKTWSSNPVKFIRWALKNGWRQSLLIDRKNNDGDYKPSNCRFVTLKESNRNRRKHFEF